MCAIIIPGSPRASYLVAGGDCQMSEGSTVTLSLSHYGPSPPSKKIAEQTGGVTVC